ncbi:MAG: OmpA family protein [Brachymonas sp.]|nr:OmpA family protein [Brachymonas sp.]
MALASTLLSACGGMTLQGYPLESNASKNQAAVSQPVSACQPIMQDPRYEWDAFFDHGSAVLNGRNTPHLLELVDKIKASRVALDTIVLTGFTVPGESTRKGSMRLSLDRAKAVQQFLIRQGVTAREMHIEGKGNSQAVGQGHSAETHAQNRKVAIFIVFKPSEPWHAHCPDYKPSLN